MLPKHHSLGQGALRVSLLALLLIAFHGQLRAASPTPLPAPQPAAPLFRERPFGPLPPPTEAPVPKRLELEDEKPIPREWIIGGTIAGMLALLGVAYGSARAWHRSNIFDQQYRFPVKRSAALRFGGQRSGGQMASVSFGTVDAVAPKARLEPKNA